MILRSNVTSSMPDVPLAELNLIRPFAVLLDANDKEWSDGRWVCRKTIELLDVGCRYFVCFGPHSESVHDQIDDVIIERGSELGVLTTFHEDEAAEDVANFFSSVVMSSLSYGLLLVRDEAGWRLRL